MFFPQVATEGDSTPPCVFISVNYFPANFDPTHPSSENTCLCPLRTLNPPPFFFVSVYFYYLILFLVPSDSGSVKSLHGSQKGTH